MQTNAYACEHSFLCLYCRAFSQFPPFFCRSNYSIAEQVLSDPVQRMVYDEIHGYALTALNPFLDDSCPKDHAFVDEFSCIGMWQLFPEAVT